MYWLRLIYSQLYGLLRKNRIEEEMEDEIRFHLLMRTRENIERGMRPEEAEREARRRFGNVERIKDLAHDIKGGGLMETLLQDLRYGARMLMKTPGFTLIAVLTLAIGIGANTAIFSVVNGALLKPLPYEESERLVFVAEQAASGGQAHISYPNFTDWRAQNRVFERIGVFNSGSYNLTVGDETEIVVAGQVTADLFAALRVNAAVGRVFTNEDDRPRAAPVVVLSQDLWRRVFGGDPQIVGQRILLDGYGYTVIGVAPRGFSVPSGAAIWVSAGLMAAHRPDWQQRGNYPQFYGIARLKPGATLEQARSDLDNIAVGLEKQYPDTNKGRRVRIIPLLENYVGDTRPALRILMGVVSFVLLIGCANVASLALARATKRASEMAIRAALGASAGRIVRQLLTESLLLALLGGALGLVIAQWGVKLILAIAPPNAIPRASEIRLDNRVLLFTAVVSALTGVLFGLLPALQTRRPDVQGAMKKTSRGATDHKQWLRGGLLIAEIALTMVLLVGAGLLIRSFWQLHQVATGFDYDHLLSFNIALSPGKYPELERQIRFFQQVSERISALPGVESVGLSSRLPLRGGGWQARFLVEGQPTPALSQWPAMDASVVDANYFKTMKIPLIGGRWFNEWDDRSHLMQEATKGMNALQKFVAGLRAVIIDEEFARRYFPNGDAIGKRIRINGEDPKDPVVTVVGIVGRVKLEEPSRDSNRVQGYFPFLQLPFGPSIIVRSRTSPEALMAAVRREVRNVDPSQPIHNVRTLEQIRSESIAPERFILALVGSFAAIALVLATVGIYGLLSYSVARRTREIGIRMALGAQARDVRKLVMRQGLSLALTGVAIGLACAFALTQVINTLLFEVSPTDPLTFALIALLLALVALLACWIPARRATKVDPMVALRSE
jgi:putative ABC transport system permease protein